MELGTSCTRVNAHASLSGFQDSSPQFKDLATLSGSGKVTYDPLTGQPTATLWWAPKYDTMSTDFITNTDTTCEAGYQAVSDGLYSLLRGEQPDQYFNGETGSAMLTISGPIGQCMEQVQWNFPSDWVQIPDVVYATAQNAGGGVMLTCATGPWSCNGEVQVAVYSDSNCGTQIAVRLALYVDCAHCSGVSACAGCVMCVGLQDWSPVSEECTYSPSAALLGVYPPQEFVYWKATYEVNGDVTLTAGSPNGPHPCQTDRVTYTGPIYTGAMGNTCLRPQFPSGPGTPPGDSGNSVQVRCASPSSTPKPCNDGHMVVKVYSDHQCTQVPVSELPPHVATLAGLHTCC